MSRDEAAQPAPEAPLVILAADDDAVCVDELCLPADVPSMLEPPSPAPEVEA